MSSTKQNHRSSADGESTTAPDWISEAINGGSFRRVDLENGTNGWSSPPGNLFSLRSKNYFNKKQKSPGGDYLLCPAGMDWLKSSTKLDNLLSHRNNRVAQALREAQSEDKFVLAVNLQVPGKDQHSAVFYFAAADPIPPGSLLHKFVSVDSDAYRNQRFKIVSRIVKGPWVVRKTVGNHSACLLGKALTCNYHRGPNYLEIDVDVGSSAIATAILRLALGFVTSVTVDMGFLVEAQEEEELPERLIGAVRVSQMEMSAAAVVEMETSPSTTGGRGSIGLAKVNHHESGEEEDDRTKL